MPTLPDNVGFAPPPPGVTPNLDAPRVSPLYSSVAFILLALSATAISLRFYTRKVLLRTLGADDYLLVVAFAFAAISTIASQLQVRYGLGSHVWDVPLSDSPMYLKLFLVGTTTYIAGIMFVKLSLLFLYRRVALPGDRHFEVAWWATAFIVVGYTIPSLFVTVFQCRPIRASWDITYGRNHPVHCVNQAALFISHGVLNAVTDVIFLALPLPSVWGMSIGIRQKIIIVLLFTLGSFTCVVSILRLTQIVIPRANLKLDWTKGALSASIWSLVELNCGMICASCLSLRPFFRKYLDPRRRKAQGVAYPAESIYRNAEFSKTGAG